MAIIRRDEIGLYAKVGGWIARPTEPSVFDEGEKVVGKHFGGSTIYMGKVPGSRKGEYQEYWQVYRCYLS